MPPSTLKVVTCASPPLTTYLQCIDYHIRTHAKEEPNGYALATRDNSKKKLLSIKSYSKCCILIARNVVFLKHGVLDYSSFLGRIVYPTPPHNQWRKLVMNSQTIYTNVWNIQNRNCVCVLFYWKQLNSWTTEKGEIPKKINLA